MTDSSTLDPCVEVVTKITATKAFPNAPDGIAIVEGLAPVFGIGQYEDGTECGRTCRMCGNGGSSKPRKYLRLDLAVVPEGDPNLLMHEDVEQFCICGWCALDVAD